MVEFAMSFLLYISRSKFPGVRKVTKDEWYKQLFENLGKSTFRSRFHLKQVDIDYINSKGLDKIEEHARDFIVKREAPAVIPNDGKQTPMRGHPVFIAQHAPATCCPWLALRNGTRSSQGNN